MFCRKDLHDHGDLCAKQSRKQLFSGSSHATPEPQGQAPEDQLDSMSGIQELSEPEPTVTAENSKEAKTADSHMTTEITPVRSDTENDASEEPKFQFETTNLQKVRFNIGDIVVIGESADQFHYAEVEKVNQSDKFTYTVDILYQKLDRNRVLQPWTKGPSLAPWRDSCPLNCIIKRLKLPTDRKVDKTTQYIIKDLVKEIFNDEDW